MYNLDLDDSHDGHAKIEGKTKGKETQATQEGEVKKLDMSELIGNKTSSHRLCCITHCDRQERGEGDW